MKKLVFLIVAFFTISIIEAVERVFCATLAMKDLERTSAQFFLRGGGIVGSTKDPFIFEGVFEGYGENPEILPDKMAHCLNQQLQSYVAGRIHTHDFNQSSSHVGRLFAEAARSTLYYINGQKKSNKEVSAVLAYYNFVTQNMAVINFGASAVISQRVGGSQEFVQEKRNLEELASGFIRPCYECSFSDDRFRPAFSPRLILIGTNNFLEEVKDALCDLYQNNCACAAFSLYKNMQLLQGLGKTYQKGIINALQLRSCVSCPLTPKEEGIIECLLCA